MPSRKSSRPDASPAAAGRRPARAARGQFESIAVARQIAGLLEPPSEVAEQLRVSTMTVYRLIKSGELPAAKISSSYRLREEDVDAFLYAMGRSIGPPWQASHKLAAAAALVATGHPARRR